MKFVPIDQRITTRFRQRLLLSIAIGVFLNGMSLAAEKTSAWNGFLGPARNGISEETGLLEKFPATGPKELWRASLGEGMANVAIGDGRIITLHQDADQQYVVALDVKSGETMWSTAIGPHYRNSMGNGPRATPTISESTVYAYSGEGILAAMKLQDGKLLWKKNLPQEFGCKPSEYGMSCSPLVVGKTVVVQVGETGTLAAVDQKTGDVVWKVGNDPAGYSSPILIGRRGVNSIIAFTGASAMEVSDVGKILWRYPYKTDYFCNTATPVRSEDRLLISSGENHGSTLLDLKSGKPQNVWTSLGRKSTLRAEWQTPVLLDGYLYGFDNVGSAGPVTHLTCVEFATGKMVWQKTRFGKGNLTTADGKLFISTMKGELVLVKASPDAFTELSRAKVIETTRQAPVVSDGKIFLRGNGELVCFDGRK